MIGFKMSNFMCIRLISRYLCIGRWRRKLWNNEGRLKGFGNRNLRYRFEFLSFT